jgi:hypothetical protein
MLLHKLRVAHNKKLRLGEKGPKITSPKESAMKCRRCLNESQHFFCVYTDEINMMVCASCANEARRLGLPVRTVSGEVAALSLMIPDGSISRE